jgi:hypothetical protein
MFIYFWEQVWSDEFTSCRWNFITAEIQRRYWEHFNYLGEGTGYPQGRLEEGNDYVDY